MGKTIGPCVRKMLVEKECIKLLGNEDKNIMKYMPNMNDNIDKYSVMKEEKGSFVLIGLAVAAVIIMVIMSF